MATTTWTIDPGHTQLQFKVRHLAIANVAGIFTSIRGTAKSDNDTFDHAEVDIELDTASLHTNNSERDNHLRSEIFLHAAQYPVISFKGVLQKELLTGMLSIHGVTKEVTLQATHTGSGEGRFGDKRVGFEINGKFNRKDFGLDFNLLTAAGSLVVGEEIRIQGDIELIQKA